jgi:AraC family transcriptional regulator of arabinose operon
MGQAAERLLAQDASIGRVAEELGFSDPFHFSRVFKKVFGVPPGQFARSHRRTYRRPGLTSET